MCYRILNMLVNPVVLSYWKAHIPVRPCSPIVNATLGVCRQSTLCAPPRCSFAFLYSRCSSRSQLCAPVAPGCGYTLLYFRCRRLLLSSAGHSSLLFFALQVALCNALLQGAFMHYFILTFFFSSKPTSPPARQVLLSLAPPPRPSMRSLMPRQLGSSLPLSTKHLGAVLRFFLCAVLCSSLPGAVVLSSHKGAHLRSSSQGSSYVILYARAAQHVSSTRRQVLGAPLSRGSSAFLLH